jgi:hypothetical protein
LTVFCGCMSCLQAAADAAADARPAGRSKSAKGKAGSKGKAGGAAGQSAAAAAAEAMLQDPQHLQLAGLLAVMAGMSPQVGLHFCCNFTACTPHNVMSSAVLSPCAAPDAKYSQLVAPNIGV